jgi:hypothetical protein
LVGFLFWRPTPKNHRRGKQATYSSVGWGVNFGSRFGKATSVCASVSRAFACRAGRVQLTVTVHAWALVFCRSLSYGVCPPRAPCGRLICVALCQGAGLHYVDIVRRRPRPNGVKDFDVWSFFARIPGEKFPAYRRNRHLDFGPSKFGRWRSEPRRFRHFEGRRVDLFMRDLSAGVGADPVESLRAWLEEQRTKTQRLLAKGGVVLLQPRQLIGKIVWPPPGRSKPTRSRSREA